MNNISPSLLIIIVYMYAYSVYVYVCVYVYVYNIYVCMYALKICINTQKNIDDCTIVVIPLKNGIKITYKSNILHRCLCP